MTSAAGSVEVDVVQAVGLERIVDLDLRAAIPRGTVMQPPWWYPHSDEGWAVLGAVLGYPGAMAYARLTGGRAAPPGSLPGELSGRKPGSGLNETPAPGRSLRLRSLSVHPGQAAGAASAGAR